MARVSNYDDLAGFKTPTQRRTKGQVAQILADMKRIDAVVANGTFEQLKALHVELDGTYQNRIKKWGTSMYHYIEGMGFTYEFIGDDALRENLATMKGKLRGLLFEIDPNAEEHVEQVVSHQTSGEYRMNKKQRKLIADYAQIKQKASGNIAITIQAEEYPRYKDTLDYMVEYEYFNKDITKEDNLIILPIGLKLPFDPIDYLKQDFAGAQNDFVNAVIQSIRKLDGAGVEDSIVVGFSLITDKVKNIKNADIIAALTNEEGAVPLQRAIRYTDDPNAPEMRVKPNLPPLRYADLKEKLKEKKPTIKFGTVFYTALKIIKANKNYCQSNYLDPDNKSSTSCCYRFSESR